MLFYLGSMYTNALRATLNSRRNSRALPGSGVGRREGPGLSPRHVHVLWTYMKSGQTTTQELFPLQNVGGEKAGINTGLPLTLSFTIDPSPSLTQAAVASAYAAYASACGTQLAQAEQDELAEFNFEEGLNVTDVNDPGFLQFAGQDPAYQQASVECQAASNALDASEFGLTGDDTTGAPPSSAASSMSSSAASSASSNAGGSTAPSATSSPTSFSSPKTSTSVGPSSTSKSNASTASQSTLTSRMLLGLIAALFANLLLL
ncbi:hypothetical protein C8R44DRAFT_865266 [Mycena epipterygia]|nr:hypothetical protein C8R44DRAFT_865266 [Mycena epipterygia]